jgi:hypothetical protein
MLVETPMCKYWYNNHHIEVNLDPRDGVMCGPSTMTEDTMQFIRLQMSYDELRGLVKVHSDIDVPFK